MDIITAYLPPLIETIYMYYFFNNFVGRKTLSYIDFIFAATKTIFLGGILSNPILIPIISLIIDSIYIFIVSRKRLINTFITYSLTFISLIIFQLVVVIITSIFGLSGMGFSMQLLCNILTLILVLVVCRLFDLHKLHTLVLNSKKPLKLSLINAFLLIFSVLLVFKLDHSQIYSNIPFYIALISLIIIANICIIYYEQTLSTKQKELEAYQKNIPIYETLISDIRANQHEYDNRIQALQNLSITCKDYDSLKGVLDEYTCTTRTVSHAYALLHINMPLLAAALYSHVERAAKQNIIVQFSIKSTTLKSNAPEYKLSDFACVILQNAIEASKPGDYINAELNCINEQVYLSIMNPVERFYEKAELAAFLKKGYTTKNNKKGPYSTPHGYGLYSVHKSIKEYNGTIGFDCTELDNKYWIEFNIQV